MNPLLVVLLNEAVAESKRSRNLSFYGLGTMSAKGGSS